MIPVSAIFILHRTFSCLLLIGRTTSGILYGIILVTLISHAADNSSKFLRRHFMWPITIINLLPTVLLAEIISNATGDVTASAVTDNIGVIMFALAILALIFMPFTYESIVFLLNNGKDLRALEIMLKLRNESRHYIRRDFNELKIQVAEDNNDEGNIFTNGNLRPIILVSLLRLLTVLLTNNCIYWIFLANVCFGYQHWMCSTALSKQFSGDGNYLFENHTILSKAENSTFDELFINSIDETVFDKKNVISDLTDSEKIDVTFLKNESVLVAANNVSASRFFIHSVYTHQLPPLQITRIILIVSIIKIAFGVPFLCFTEKFQVYRNRVIFKVTIGIGVINLIFFTATLLCNHIDDSLLFTFYIAKMLGVIYSFYLFVAFSIDVCGLGELSESFSLTKRYRCIAFISICEHSAHVIAILLVVNALFKFYFYVVQSAVICFICYLLLKWMPNECLSCSLYAARDKHFVKTATINN